MHVQTIIAVVNQTTPCNPLAPLTTTGNAAKQPQTPPFSSQCLQYPPRMIRIHIHARDPPKIPPLPPVSSSVCVWRARTAPDNSTRYL